MDKCDPDYDLTQNAPFQENNVVMIVKPNTRELVFECYSLEDMANLSNQVYYQYPDHSTLLRLPYTQNIVRKQLLFRYYDAGVRFFRLINPVEGMIMNNRVTIYIPQPIEIRDIGQGEERKIEIEDRDVQLPALPQQNVVNVAERLHELRNIIEEEEDNPSEEALNEMSGIFREVWPFLSTPQAISIIRTAIDNGFPTNEIAHMIFSYYDIQNINVADLDMSNAQKNNIIAMSNAGMSLTNEQTDTVYEFDEETSLLFLPTYRRLREEGIDENDDLVFINAREVGLCFNAVLSAYDIPILERIVNRGGDVGFDFGEDGMEFIKDIIEENNPRQVEALEIVFRVGVQPTERDLDLALRNQNLPIIRLLIRELIIMERTETIKRKIIKYLSSNNILEILRIMFDLGITDDAGTIIQRAVKQNKPAVVRYLLTKAPMLHGRKIVPVKLIQTAIDLKFTEVLEELLRAGIRPYPIENIILNENDHRIADILRTYGVHFINSDDTYRRMEEEE